LFISLFCTYSNAFPIGYHKIFVVLIKYLEILFNNIPSSFYFLNIHTIDVPPYIPLLISEYILIEKKIKGYF